MCPAGRAHCAWGGHFVTCVSLGLALSLVAINGLSSDCRQVLRKAGIHVI
jgi:hypothetical protein